MFLEDRLDSIIVRKNNMGLFSSVKENAIRERVASLQKNADNGDKEAMRELGKYYSNLPECRSYVCNTIQKNDNKAFHLFAKAAQRTKSGEVVKYDDIDSAYLAAMCYAWGYGINQDCYKATIIFASMMIQAEDEGYTEMNYQIRSNVKKMLPEFKRRAVSRSPKDVFNYAVLLSIIGEKKQSRLSEGLMDDLERKNYADAIRFNKGIDNDDITRYIIPAQN